MIRNPLVLSFFTGTLVAATTGCGPATTEPGAAPTSDRNDSPGVVLISAFDRSASFGLSNALPSTVLSNARLARRLDPARDRLTLFRVADETYEFLDGAPDERATPFEVQIAQGLRQPPSRKGTYPCRFWIAVDERLREAEGHGTDAPAFLIALWSDGDDDERPNAHRLHSAQMNAALRRLSASPHVRGVFFYGVKFQNRARLRRQFQTLGPKLHLGPPTLSSFESLIDRLHQSAAS